MRSPGKKAAANRTRHKPAAIAVFVTIAVVSSLFTTAPLARGQGERARADSDVRQIYVPAQDFDSVLTRDKRGVLLPRNEFEDLLAKARHSAHETPNVPNGIAVNAADYNAKIAGTQLVITASVHLTQIADGLRSIELPFRGVAVESAKLDAQPALLARNGQSLEVFSDRKGAHTLALELTAPLSSSGADRVTAFGLGGQPIGMLSVTVPAEERLFVDELRLERPDPLAKEAIYRIPVGGRQEIRLRISSRDVERPADRLLFAKTLYRLHVSPGDAAWQATTSLDVYGAAIDHLTATIPAGLEISDVESSGLESWNVTKGSGQKPATITLVYRQPFRETRTVVFQGIFRPGDGKKWTVGGLRIAGADSHVGRVKIEWPPELRFQLLTSSQVRPALDAAHVFDTWNDDFSLSFTAEPRPPEVTVDALTALELTADGLNLRVEATLKSALSPLFEAKFTLPAEWIVTGVTVGDKTAAWNNVSAEAGTHHLVVPLAQPLPAGAPLSLAITASRSISPWPIDESGVEISLPEVGFLNVANVDGSYVVRAPDDFDLIPSETTGLDPSHLNLERERIGYRFQGSGFSGKLKIVRRPARLSAETLLVARLDPAALRTYVRTTIEAGGGGVRRLIVLLPPSVENSVRFHPDRADVRIVEQKVLDAAGGQRLWSLTFDQFVKGTVNLLTVIDTPRGNAQEFRVPEPHLEGVSRQSGMYIAEASNDQQVNVTAVGSDKQPLPEVDPHELPSLSFAPADRVVAAFRFVQPNNRVTLTDAKLARVPVARAVCKSCEIETVIAKTGGYQHRANFQFVSSGAQSVRATLPENSALWSTLIDGKPVEVRNAGGFYLIPLDAATSPDAERTLSLVYATTPAPSSEPPETRPSSSQDQGLRLRQSPPTVSIVDGAGTPETMEILSRTWRLYYPRDLYATQSDGAFEPSRPLASLSPIAQIAGQPNLDSTTQFWWKLLYAAVTIGAIVLCINGFANLQMRGLFAALGVIVVLGVCAALFVPSCSEHAPMYRMATRWDDVGYQPSGPRDSVFQKAASPMKAVSDQRRLAKSATQMPQGEMGGEQAASKGSGPVAQAPVQQGFMGGGRLSMPVEFVAPDEDSVWEFRFLGDSRPPREQSATASPQIDVQFESVSRYRNLCCALIVLVAFLLWCLRGISRRGKVLLGTMGLMLPVALAGLVPIAAQVWLDGIFFGTLGGLLLWALHAGILADDRRRTIADVGSRKKALTSAVGIVAILVSSSTAVAGPVDDATGQQPVASKRDDIRVFVPYDLSKDPLSADRVFLDQRTFLELWNQAHPEKPLANRPSREAEVAGAIYSASLAGVPHDSGNAHIAVSGRIVLESFDDRPATVTLPFRQVAVRSARLDGQPAALLTTIERIPGSQPTPRFQTVLAKKGVHLLDVEFDVPARIVGESGGFALKLSPVASGRLSFALPANGAEIRLTGLEAGFRRRSESGKEWVDIPIASATDVTVAWQPQRVPAKIGSALEADGSTALSVEDSGLQVHCQYQFRSGDGTISELAFSLPPELKLRDVRGNDIAAWKIEGEAAARRLAVKLRGDIRRETKVELDFFRALAISNSETPLRAPLIAPLNVVRETGSIGFFAGPQFEIGSGPITNVRRIDPSDFRSPQADGTAAETPRLAYRYTSRPIQLEWSVSRRRTATDVSAIHGILLGRRKLTISSRFHVQVSSGQLDQVSLLVPVGFAPQSVQGPSIADWFLDAGPSDPKQTSRTLVIEFSTPQDKWFDLNVSGTITRAADEPKISLQVPLLAGVRRSQSVLAIWPDVTYQAKIDRTDDWRSMNPDQVPAENKSLAPQPPTFAFETSRPQPGPVVLDLTRAAVRLSGDSATIVTVTDPSIFYTLALHWTIAEGAADTFLLTTPDWLAGRLDFVDPSSVNARNPRLRQVTSSKLPDGRTRWTISLQDPVREQFFLTATAVLAPPADGKIAAPSLGFEPAVTAVAGGPVRTLDTQRHFVVLVNESSARLVSIDARAIETIPAADLPIQMETTLLRQAMEVGRMTGLPAIWRMERAAAQKAAPAVVNLADLTTVVERNGSWRTRAIYHVKNRSRQFVSVQMPAESEILSVWVHDKPSRPVMLDAKEKTLRLIPLPATSEADLAVEVRLILAGRLSTGPLPRGFHLVPERLQLPAPQIVSPETDAAYGIPVARTEWTVYFPDDQEINAVDDSRQTNMSLSNATVAAQFERAALIDEMKQLYSGLLQFGSGLSDRPYRERALFNMSRLNGELSKSLQSGERAEGMDARGKDERSEAAELDRKIQQFKSQGTPFADSNHNIERNTNAEKERLTPESQALQAKDLLVQNSPALADEGKSKKKLTGAGVFKQNPSSPGSNVRIRISRTIDEAEDGKKSAVGKSTDNPTAFGLQSPALAPPAPSSPPVARAQSAQMPAEPRLPGTLSLAFDIPTSGQKLVFTKPGGDPKLTVGVRAQKSFTILLAVVWMPVWTGLALALLATLGRGTKATAGRKYLPRTVIAVGLVVFLLTSGVFSWIGLGVVAVATAFETVRGDKRGTPVAAKASGRN